MTRPPIAISYQPKAEDYLPVVVAAIRRHLGDWPIVLVTQQDELPPEHWLQRNGIQSITDWSYSEGANKVMRLWEHQAVLSRHYEKWIWWHDDMLLLRPIADPESEFARAIVRQPEKRRPNKELTNWQRWLWDTLNFFQCQGIAAPNPVLHIPRLIERRVLEGIPSTWLRDRLLFEPTYLLWHWHHQRMTPELAEGYRKGEFKDKLCSLDQLEREGYTILCWGKKIDHSAAREEFGKYYPLDFDPPH
ncbi:MAG: hypothetical protein Hals2KO_15850 [Halioglobus sp.]